MPDRKFTKQQLADFKAYVRVQRGGRYNMLDPRARQAAGLSQEAYVFVIDNYEALEAAAKGAGRV